ncbi:MAG: transporter substrate-binding domain-containing protein [Paenibacillaceae bacterium]
MKRIFITAIALILVASLAAACGKSGSKDALGQIKSAGAINVGIEGAYPPFNSVDSKNELEGFDVDITNELAKRMGIKVNFIVTPWDSIIAGLLAKKYEVILSSMAITDERKQKVDFSDAYYTTGSSLFVPNDTTLTDPKLIKDKRIGVSIGTTFEKRANELGAKLTTYKNDQLAFQDLAAGRLDGILTDKAVGANLVKAKNYPVKILGEPLLAEKAGITLNKNQTTLKDELNKHLKAMMSDGTYEQISTKWFGQDIR